MCVPVRDLLRFMTDTFPDREGREAHVDQERYVGVADIMDADLLDAARLEKKWYEEVYLNDPTQELCIIIDKQNMKPFGTTGHTDLDIEKKCCIGGRLLLGDESYANHPAFFESFFIGTDIIYETIDIMYAHVVKQNKKALKLNKMLGFIPNTGEIQYPHELHRNGHDQVELYRTREMYLKVRDKIFDKLGDALFS